MKTFELNIPIGELFLFLGIDNDNLDCYQFVDRVVEILTPTAYTQVRAWVKKRGAIYKYEYEDGTIIKCDERHLVKSHDGSFQFISRVNKSIVRGKLSNIVSNTFIGYSDVYDLSIDSPHEYETSAGVLCHNTSLAKLIIKSIKCDFIYINASDENSVDTVRIKIKNFASSMGFNDLKVVILDEADFLTASAQAALRNLMETFSVSTRFILTCNYQERIIEPILSRCQSFQVVPPNKKDVARLLVKVLTAENVKFNTEAVVAIVQAHYPDIRAVLNVAQRGVINGELQLDKEAIMEGDVKSKVIELIKSSDKKQAFKDIRQLLADNSIRNFADFYSLLYEKVDEYAPKSQADVIMAIADAQFRDAAVVDKEINFCVGIINILNSIK